MLQVKDIQEQVKLMSNAKRRMKLNGIEIKNIEMLRLTHIKLHSNIMWKSITVHSKIVAIGPMKVVCQYCKAFKFKNEADGLCCACGQVELMPLVPSLEPLHLLVSGNGPDSKLFLTHIQQYVNCFQIMSFGAKKSYSRKFYANFQDAGSNIIIMYIHS
jgi:hypothetical protein